MQTAAFVTAGLSRQTAAAAVSLADDSQSFILVPPQTCADVGGSSSAASPRSLPGSSAPLPLVWQDMFAAARTAQATDLLDAWACRPPPDEARRSVSGGGSGGISDISDDSAATGASAPAAAAAAADNPTLGIRQATVFTRFLHPEALVRRHRLGAPEARRLFQVLQVHSLGSHQAVVEITAHARERGLLLLAVWRGFAMLWDSALQVIFPAETVQQGRERQAAMLAGERLLEQLGEAEAAAAALQQENAALRQQTEGAVVQMLSVQADVEVERRRAATLQQQLKAAQAESAARAGEAQAARRDLLLLQDKLAALLGPQEDLHAQAQRLEAALKEKQAQMSAAARQAAAAAAGREEAESAARGERLKREAAEARARQLTDYMNAATLQLRAAASAALARERQAEEDERSARAAAVATAAAREDAAATAAAERGEWQREALAAKAQAADLQRRLEAAEAATAAERARGEELVAVLFPLTARVKALEAAAAAAAAAAATAATAAAAARG